MIKPTKAELYEQLDKTSKDLATAMIDRNWLAAQHRELLAENQDLEAQLSKSIVTAAKEISELQDEIDVVRREIYREREAGVADFNRYADHLSKLKRQVNRANWYVATMFVATVSMACMAAIAIFVC